MRTLVLDTEAVQALLSTDHRKHRIALAHLEGALQRRRKGTTVTVVVPTAVRVEAGWDRSRPEAALANRLRIVDRPLDTGAANTAAEIAPRTGVSVDDAHVGAVARGVEGEDIIVLSSDPDDMKRVSEPKAVKAIRI